MSLQEIRDKMAKLLSDEEGVYLATDEESFNVGVRASLKIVDEAIGESFCEWREVDDDTYETSCNMWILRRVLEGDKCDRCNLVIKTKEAK